jgi:hypothetical protein
MYVVYVKDRPQSYNGTILSFCTKNPTIFVKKIDAENAIKDTIDYAKKNGYDNSWAICTGVHKIKEIKTFDT